MKTQHFCHLLGLIALSWTVGCGSSSGLATVTGKVTLDGQPLANATVTFQPAEGRASTGETDSQGNYVLHYSATENGAELGTHKVSISTEVQGYTSEGEGADVASRPEILPAKYHAQTELTATVDSGSNTIDFALESGPTAASQPDA